MRLAVWQIVSLHMYVVACLGSDGFGKAPSEGGGTAAERRQLQEGEALPCCPEMKSVVAIKATDAIQV